MADEKSGQVKVHYAIAQALRDNGVETLFGLMGDANLYMVDSFVRDHGGTYVSAPNEAGATQMALGYAYASGKVGVFTVTHGPALSNTLTSLIEGVKAQLPIVMLCGDTPVIDKDNLQNTPQRDLILATGAGFEQLRHPTTLSEDIAIAFRRATLERRPIALNMPVEFQWQDVEYKKIVAKLSSNRALVPESEDLDNALGIIAGAKRPIIVAGRGAFSAEVQDAIKAFAQRTDALLATTLKGKNMWDGEDFNLGIFGTLSNPVASDVIGTADCVIFFGCSLNKFTAAEGSLIKGKRIVQVNAEREEIGRFFAPDAGVVGDIALTAKHFIHWLDQAEIKPSGFRSEDIRRQIANYSPYDNLPVDKSTSTTLDFIRALLRLNETLPKNRFLVTDGGRFVGQAWKYIDVPKAGDFVFTVHFGSIGFGMAEAVGASYAVPDRPVVMVTGDGGFMLGGVTEFNTAVRHKRDLIVILCNDNAYGAEHIQFRAKNMPPEGSMFDWPEFADVANAMGGIGVTVRTMDDLEKAIEIIAKRDRPVLLDLKLDPDRMPGFY